MEVLYHIRPYELWGYSLTYASKIGLIYGIGTSNQSVPEMAIDYWWLYQLASTPSMDTNFLNSNQFQHPTTRICLRKPAKLELLFPRDFPVVEPSQVDFQVKSNQNIPPFLQELTSQVILLGKHPSQQSALKWLIGINIY